MKNMITPVKGTRDFYPEIKAVHSWLYSKVRKVSERYGYQEYEGPFLESIDLYAAKSGEELVKEQSFVFPDRGGDLITLRPELTPTLARMVAQRQKQLIFPLRWWSFGPFWRYEKPQKGRSREFYQWNIDLIGVNTPQADAELIAIIVNFFQELGLDSKQVKIFVNDRLLMESELNLLGIPSTQQPAVFRLIDRREKMAAADWERYSLEEGLTQQQIAGVKSILDNKDLWKKSENLITIFDTLKAINLINFVEYDPNIIRGLDYYTATVFEAKDIGGTVRRSILGGGRYDNLLADVGGEQVPAVGFAMGDVVISLILENYGCIPPQIFNPPASVFVTTFSNETLLASLSLAETLRAQGMNVITYPEAVNLNKQLKFADRMKIKYAIFLGPDEIAQSVCTLKSLSNGSQEKIPLSEVPARLSQILDEG